MSTLTQACEQSFSKGETEEEIKQFSDLRENLIACFIWLCHSFKPNDQKSEQIGGYMFDYIVKLVNAQHLTYSNEMLGNIIDLYSDLAFIFGQYHEQANFWTAAPQPQPHMTELMNKILNQHCLINIMQTVCGNKLQGQDRQERMQKLTNADYCLTKCK